MIGYWSVRKSAYRRKSLAPLSPGPACPCGSRNKRLCHNALIIKAHQNLSMGISNYSCGGWDKRISNSFSL